MSYADAIEFLYSLRLFGAKFGLENPLRLAELAGNPQERLRFIHVAGTNGKGSTCAMLESIYRAAGLKTGLFTSPHLVSFCERLEVNRVPIEEAEIVQLVRDMQRLLATFSAEVHPTFFEVVTIMALQYFAEQKCEIVIWETGLGGRLDATNIVTPLLSVITNVQRDHQHLLGHKLSEIAFEKAGIIKPGVPVVTGVEGEDALAEIEEVAAEKSAPLTTVGPEEWRSPALTRISLPLQGDYQRKNAAVALAAVQTLQKTLPVPGSAIRRGLETVSWPGRLQLVKTPSGQSILLDGAHNIDGAEALRHAIPQILAAPDAMILGMLGEKNCEEICAVLAPLAPEIFVTPVESERTAAPEILAGFCASANPSAKIVICASVGDAFVRASRAEALIVTGSLYLVGQALELLKVGARPGAPERHLNDWSVSPVMPISTERI